MSGCLGTERFQQHFGAGLVGLQRDRPSVARRRTRRRTKILRRAIRHGEREGFIDGSREPEPALFVVRAVFPFRGWPLGGRVVFDGFGSAPGQTEVLSELELDERW